MIVVFEESSNYDPKKHEWVPKLDEVGLICKTLKGLAKKIVFNILPLFGSK